MLSRFKRLLHWEGTPKPEVDINTQLYEQLRPFRLPLVLIQVCLVVGTLGYIYIEDYELIDALFQTGYTFTTTGFGSLDEENFSNGGKLFTITLIILGFITLTFSVGVLVEVINKGELLKILKERSMLYKIARLKNHMVLCYHNEYTIEVARQLQTAHIPFVVIDGRPDFPQEAKKHRYPYYIHDEPHLDLALRKAHLSSAKGAILLSKNIADNIAQIATIRLFETELERRPYYLIASGETQADVDKLKKLGANSVVAPTKLMAQRISAMAIRPDMENLLETFLYKKDTPLDMEEIIIPKNSWMVFKRIKETHLRDIAKVSIIGITEKDGKFIPMPKGETQILVDSKLLLIGTSQGIRDTKRVVRSSEKPEELKYV